MANHKVTNPTSSIGTNIPLNLKSSLIYHYLTGSNDGIFSALGRISLLQNLLVTDEIYDDIALWFNGVIEDANHKLQKISKQIEYVIENTDIADSVIPPKQVYNFFYTEKTVKPLAQLIINIDEVLFKVEGAYLLESIERDVYVEIVKNLKSILAQVRVAMFTFTASGKPIPKGPFSAKHFIELYRKAKGKVEETDIETDTFDETHTTQDETKSTSAA
ncbi:hypothetical protein [Shewanella sp. MBTL60-007]|uniref:hypothetical protein n=1 Tax=Shewanella sp. MBTL60-007 TaxID=2815911 RepID=UPI001BC49097|nr:hypothetical protein [Shewanella sp. MBTL60-007]GIU31296.1 hypothetical protein TUM3792_42910 [Shewanella sp. MBTL60-007]